MKKRASVILIFAVAVGISPAFAGGLLLPKEREALEAHGVSFDIHALEDYVSVFKGGSIHKDTWMGRFDFGVDVDLEKANILKGGLIHIDIMNAHGGLKPTVDMIGDIQTVSNIEAPRTTRLYEAWYQQTFMDSKLSMKAGLHDLNSDFAASDNGGLYINSAFGITPSIFANTTPSIYPLNTLGAMVKYAPDKSFDFMAGVYDGDPGNPDENIHNTNITLKAKQLLTIVEGAFHYAAPVSGGLEGTMKLTGWYNSGDVADVAALDENGDAVMHDDNYGGHMIIDQMLYKEAEGQGLSAFYMGGFAPQQRNQIISHQAGGLNYTGLIPKRDKDIAGIALTNVFFSKKLRESTGQDKAETAYELTYRFEINENIHVQPDFQYVKRPNGDDNIKNASVFMLRSDIQF